MGRVGFKTLGPWWRLGRKGLVLMDREMEGVQSQIEAHKAVEPGQPWKRMRLMRTTVRVRWVFGLRMEKGGRWPGREGSAWCAASVGEFDVEWLIRVLQILTDQDKERCMRSLGSSLPLWLSLNSLHVLLRSLKRTRLERRVGVACFPDNF